MTAREQAVFNRIREVAHRTVPMGGRAILYGSRARGDARSGSDWDVLIVLDKERLDNNDYTYVSYPFVMLGADLNEEINPVMYTKKEWQQYGFTPFHANVEHDGITFCCRD